MEGREHLVLGLIWQIIKIGLFSKVDLKTHPELFRLLGPDETLDELLKVFAPALLICTTIRPSLFHLLIIYQLPPDQILLRWMNYHLSRAGWHRRVTNFSSDIKVPLFESSADHLPLAKIRTLKTTRCFSINSHPAIAHALHWNKRIYLNVPEWSSIMQTF